MFSVPDCWRPVVPVEMKELKVFQSCESPTSYNLSSKSSMSMLSVGPFSLSSFKRIHHAAVAWLSMELPVLYRTYNLHAIIQLEEMNFATIK